MRQLPSFKHYETTTEKNCVWLNDRGVWLCIVHCTKHVQMTKWANKFTRQHHWNIRNGITFAYSDFQQNSNPPMVSNKFQNFVPAHRSPPPHEIKWIRSWFAAIKTFRWNFVLKPTILCKWQCYFIWWTSNQYTEFIQITEKLLLQMRENAQWLRAYIYTYVFDGVTCCQHTNRWSGRMVPSKNYVHFSYSLENFHTNLNRICIIEMHFIDHDCRECLIADGEGVINSKLI